MARYAIIDGKNVINVIDYDEPPSNPPPGFTDPIIALQSDIASPGWIYENNTFIAPPELPPIITPELTPLEKLNSIGLTISDLKLLLGL